MWLENDQIFILFHLSSMSWFDLTWNLTFFLISPFTYCDLSECYCGTITFHSHFIAFILGKDYSLAGKMGRSQWMSFILTTIYKWKKAQAIFAGIFLIYAGTASEMQKKWFHVVCFHLNRTICGWCGFRIKTNELVNSI